MFLFVLINIVILNFAKSPLSCELKKSEFYSVKFILKNGSTLKIKDLKHKTTNIFIDFI